MINKILLSGKIILASASPRRSDLLAMMGIPCDIQPGDIDETVQEGEPPGMHVRRLSLEKTQELAGRYPDSWVIGADTIVVIEGHILGKPSTTAEAEYMLKMLSGKTHQVFTGITIFRASPATQLTDAVVSDVLFKQIPEEEIRWYVRTGEPFDKAGGYALQGKGAFFIEKIHGSFTNVIGLPLCETIEMLKLAGAITFPGVDNAARD